MEKQCSKCGKIEEMKRSCCRTCKKEYDHKHYMANKDTHYEKCQEYIKSHPGIAWKSRLRVECKRAGLTVEEYHLLPKVCSFPHCGATEPGGGPKRRWIKDHDHKTGKFRGLLCHKHNALLGFADDRIEILEDAINYLKKAEGI